MTDAKQRVKNHFSERVREWAANFADHEPQSVNAQTVLSRHRFVIEMLEAAVPRGAKVLDVGCGTGEMAARLSELGYEVWGVDIADPMIRHAAQRYGSCRFRVGDIEHIPFDDDTFDAVVCLGVIEYLPDDGQALTEIRRVLKPGGNAIVSTPSALTPLYRMDRACMQLMDVARPLYHIVKYRLRGRRPPVPEPQNTIAARKYRLRKWLERLRSLGLEPQESLCHGWGWYRSELGSVVELVSRTATLSRRGLEKLLGQVSLRRAANALVRSRVLNWLAWEQIVRVSALKSGVLVMSANLFDIINLFGVSA